MKMYILGLISVLGLFAVPVAGDGDDLFWMRFKANTREQRTAIANLGVTIESVLEDSVIALGHRDELEAAKKLGSLDVHFKLSYQTMDFPRHDEMFHNYDELMTSLHDLVDAYPDIAELYTMGDSVQGREIPLLVLTSANDDMALPGVLFMGGHHAREHISVEVPLLLAWHLAAQYGKDQRITHLLNTRSIYIAPVINPDGKEFDIERDQYKLWRKNVGQRSGVDLNRNYGGPGYGGSGSSSNPRSDVYHGPNAFSEPETVAVRELLETHTNITINLSFHTFSELILYPWGYKYDSIENQNDFLVHKTMAETMAQWNGYTPQQSSELYIASGDTSDWAYGSAGRISFTFELDPPMTPDKNFNLAAGFYPGQKFILPTFEKNLEPCLYLMEYADNPYRVLEPSWAAYGLNSPLVK